MKSALGPAASLSLLSARCTPSRELGGLNRRSRAYNRGESIGIPYRRGMGVSASAGSLARTTRVWPGSSQRLPKGRCRDLRVGLPSPCRALCPDLGQAGPRRQRRSRTRHRRPTATGRTPCPETTWRRHRFSVDWLLQNPASERSGALGGSQPRLSDDLWDRYSVDVGQPHIASVVAIRQLRMVDAEQMEHRGMKVVG